MNTSAQSLYPLALLRRLTDSIERSRRWGRVFVLALPYAWLLVFFLVPFLIVFKMSFSETRISIPPYAPLWTVVVDDIGGYALQLFLNMENYLLLFSDDLYFFAWISSISLAGISTLTALAVAYPIAYGMARSSPVWQGRLLILVILPFWTSFLIRVYAWIGILKDEGLLNLLLSSLGIISEPLHILHSNVAVVIGIVYSYLPFMLLPIYAILIKLDDSLGEAAADLGARGFQVFWRVTFPLSLPGVVAGCLLVFIPAVGEFVIPDLLGGADTLMIGKVLWTEFFSNRDWPLASAAAVILLLLLLVPIVWFQRVQMRLDLAR